MGGDSVEDASARVAPLEPRDLAADLALARAAAEGDARARAEVVTRLLKRVRTTVHYMTADAATADDVAQLTLAKILRSIATYHGEGSLEAWADRIGVRIALRLCRQERRHDEARTRHRELLQPAAPANDAEAEAIQRELRRRLGSALAKIAEPRRVVLIMSLVLRHSIAEIAATLDVPINTVRDRLQKGKQELRRCVERDPALRELAGRSTP